MKTIKVIDLLNKIANKEEVPKKIKKGDKTYKYNGSWEDYYYETVDDYFFQTMLEGNRDMSLILNDEVEIIEDAKTEENASYIDKGMKWYSIDGNDKVPDTINYMNHNFNVIFEKLGEIIDYINKKEGDK